MNIEELNEALEELGLEEVLPNGFRVETDSQGQVIITTGLAVDEDSGELVDFVDEDEDDEEDEEFDPDFEPLDDEDDEDE